MSSPTESPAEAARAAQPQAQPQRESWLRRNHRNKPQSNSAGAASLVFLSGGMSMIWSLGFQYSTHFRVDQHMMVCWFIGAVIGAPIGALACHKFHKKTLTCFSALLVTISGIVVAAKPNSFAATMAARYINGLAVGLAFPPTLVVVGEEVVKDLRGMVAASVDTMSFAGGVFVQILVAVCWTDNSPNSTFSAAQMCGVLHVLYGVLAFLLAYFFAVESPIFYLSRGQEQMAIDALRRLQRPFTITAETHDQLEEHKRYLAANREMTLGQSASRGLPALLKLCSYRCFVAMSCSLFVNYALVVSSTFSSGTEVWPYIVYGALRFVGAFVACFLLDSVGRKRPTIMGFVVCCGLALAVGGIMGDLWNVTSAEKMSVVKWLLIVQQLFAGIGLASVSAYLAEAFPLAVKPYYIACVFAVEMLVHIIICVNRVNVVDLSDYFYAQGGLSLAFFIFAIFWMPETRALTLREALATFRTP